MVEHFLQAIAGVNSAWSIAAFAIAAVLALANSYVSRSGPGKAATPVTSIIWGAVVVICVLGALPILANTYLESQKVKLLTIYRVRVVAVDAQGIPLDGVTLRSSASNETSTTAQGIGQVAIPRGSLPADGKVTIYADLNSAFLHGRSDIQLANDPNPSMKIELNGTRTATLTGLVEDEQGRAVPGARVGVLGGESGISSDDGRFTLRTNAAVGQTVRLHIEKNGYRPSDQDQPAGSAPITVMLVAERAPKSGPRK